jgi:hypothetical protein
MTERPAMQRRQLLALFGIGFATLGAAYVLFYLASEGGVWRTTNHGEFVEPPLAVTALELADAHGARPDLAGSWWLWTVAADGCGSECGAALHRLRALHVLLNKDATRLRRALVVPAVTPHSALEEDPGLLLLGAPGLPLADGIYIVDPIGNLVLFYPYAAAGAPVLEDLKRLLRLSQIG